MVTPAMLHGGSQGEIIAPLEKVGGLGSVVNVNIKIQAWDGMDVTRVVNTQVIPRLKQAITLNTGNFGTAIRGTT
jgi:hypothetical protein